MKVRIKKFRLFYIIFLALGATVISNVFAAFTMLYPFPILGHLTFIFSILGTLYSSPVNLLGLICFFILFYNKWEIRQSSRIGLIFYGGLYGTFIYSISWIIMILHQDGFKAVQNIDGIISNFFFWLYIPSAILSGIFTAFVVKAMIKAAKYSPDKSRHIPSN